MTSLPGVTGRGELQHLVDGEAAPTVQRRSVRSFAELGPELSRGFVMTCSVRHPDSRSNSASDTVGRSEQGPSGFRVTRSNSDRG
jgi:hypothetical protein